MALPPFDPGAVQLTSDDAPATVPETFVGAPGTSNAERTAVMVYVCVVVPSWAVTIIGMSLFPVFRGIKLIIFPVNVVFNVFF